ncbi:MAG: preprotein translocase subunit SecY [Methylacidiphilales bacterium]|nr:preprotein translocase subunit SecY [Candidatus Methylacidiphilales bacterium]
MVVSPSNKLQTGVVDLWYRIAFVFFAIVIFRFGSFITLPGIDVNVLTTFFDDSKNTILDLANVFSGGALHRMSIFALGVMPYISASIILQMLTHIVPSLIALRKEGESGRVKITEYTRILTILFATLQSIGTTYALSNQNINGEQLVIINQVSFIFISTITLVTGTMFLMWLGEQITERGLGNGISLIIFSSIVAGLPTAVSGTYDLYSQGELNPLSLIFIFVIVLAVVFFVVFIERSFRKIPIQYPPRQQGRTMVLPQSNHLPLKLNMSGVIPPIFASAIVLFPATVIKWFSNVSTDTWLGNIVNQLQPGKMVYEFVYVLAIVFFAFFYTSLVFNPKETAENIKKSGGYIQGIRPGEQTAWYIKFIVNRLTAIGAFYLAFVCLVPELLILYFNVPFYFGGTSILIVVVVVMDFMVQIQTHLMSFQYEKLMKRANLTMR